MPTVVVLGALVVLPTIQSIVFSVQDVAVGVDDTSSFVGFDNWTRVLTSDVFWRSMQRTLLYAVLFAALSTGLGLLFALFLNLEFPGRTVARALLILPWATPWLIIGIMWRWYLDPDVGAFSGTLVRMGIMDTYIPFLSRPQTAFLFSVIAATWRQASLSGLILLAALQTRPKILIEAARVDGANSWQTFIHVTYPWINPVLAGVVILNVIYAFLQFDVIFIMTQGGPGDATMLLSILLYRQLFIFSDFGAGSVIAIVLAVTAIGGSLLARSALRSKRYDQT